MNTDTPCYCLQQEQVSDHSLWEGAVQVPVGVPREKKVTLVNASVHSMYSLPGLKMGWLEQKEAWAASAGVFSRSPPAS